MVHKPSAATSEVVRWLRRRPFTAYDFHAKTCGHPSEFGFTEIENLRRAERWELEKLMELFQRARAKYFVALASHHDNFDTCDSKCHEWNSVRVGPKKDIVGIWKKAASPGACASA